MRLIMPIAEIVADLAGRRHPPIIEHPGHVAVNLNGFALLDDQRTVEAAPNLLETALMRVIPEGSCVEGIEFIDKALTWTDRLLRQMRYPVHGIGHAKAVPMNGCFFFETIFNNDPQALALLEADFRAGNTIAITPDGCFRIFVR